MTANPEDRFIVDEHRSARPHLDLRLQHAGATHMWALVDGLPEPGSPSGRAVQTEEELAIATDLRRVESLRRRRTNIDSGDVTVHAWTDERVLVTLHGASTGVGRLSLEIFRGRRGEDDDVWFIAAVEESVLHRRPMPVAPMLASPGLETDRLSADWRFEMKWDGVRVIADARQGTVALWSRNGRDLTGSFPEVAEGLNRAVGNREAVLDGEVVALDEDNRPSFARVQERLHVAPSAVSGAMRRVPVSVLLFDILELDGTSQVDLPYVERRSLLEDLVQVEGSVQVSPVYSVQRDTALEVSRELGLEGVVAKRGASRYRPGQRSRDWLKFKHLLSTEVVVVGWIADTTGEPTSLVLGAPADTGALRYVGRVAGLSRRDRQAIRHRLQPRSDSPLDEAADLSGEVAWVEPQLVVEVQFTDWTRAGRLRHPVWRGIRADKQVSDLEP